MNDIISRRDFVGKITLMAILASPVSRFLFEKFKPVPPPRKLKAVWKSEAAQDMRYYHALEDKLAHEIAVEIDHHILQDLQRYAV